MKPKQLIAIDLGGTFIKSGIYVDGKISNLIKTPTKATSLASVLAALHRAIEPHLCNADGIAVSSAGDIDPYRGVCVYATDNLPDFSGFDLVGHLQQTYQLAATALNDGHAALLGEATVRNLNKSAAMLTLGTGVGGAYFDGDSIVFGEDFRYGRYGHLTLVEDGLACNCGKHGCMEQYVSATALNKRCQSIGTTPEQVFTNKDEASKTAAKDYLDNLAAALETVYRSTPYDMMVLGGGVCGSASVWLPMLQQKSARSIEVSALGNAAGMYGAAVWWKKRREQDQKDGL